MASDARSPGTDDLPSFGNAILGDTTKKKGAWRTKKKKKEKMRCYLSASQPSELLILEYTMEILEFIGLYVELASLQIYHVIYSFVYCKRAGLFRICMYSYICVYMDVEIRYVGH